MRRRSSKQSAVEKVPAKRGRMGYRLNLGKHGILPAEFAERISGIVRFRNVLVHEYLIVDSLKVQEALQEGLDDLKKFIVYITDFMQREGHFQE